MTDPTPHADRDGTEPPRTYAEGAFWPPAAPAAYDTIDRIIDGVIDTVVDDLRAGCVDLDEPVPFVLTDEPAGDLLPSAPEGILLQCPACPHTLADTRGGRLVHHDDGSHTYVPPGPYGLPEFLDVVNAELEHLRAVVTRVEALADQWYAMADAQEDTYPTAARVMRINAADLRATVKGP